MPSNVSFELEITKPGSYLIVCFLGLDDLRNHLDSPDNSIPEMKFLLLEQKYLELLLRGNSLDALKVRIISRIF